MLDNEIQMLMPGETLIASPFTPFAVSAKIHLFEDYVEAQNLISAEADTAKLKKANRQEVLLTSKVEALSSPRGKAILTL